MGHYDQEQTALEQTEHEVNTEKIRDPPPPPKISVFAVRSTLDSVEPCCLIMLIES